MQEPETKAVKPGVPFAAAVPVPAVKLISVCFLAPHTGLDLAAACCVGHKEL